MFGQFNLVLCKLRHVSWTILRDDEWKGIEDDLWILTTEFVQHLVNSGYSVDFKATFVRFIWFCSVFGHPWVLFTGFVQLCLDNGYCDVPGGIRFRVTIWCNLSHSSLSFTTRHWQHCLGIGQVAVRTWTIFWCRGTDVGDPSQGFPSSKPCNYALGLCHGVVSRQSISTPDSCGSQTSLIRI